MKRRDFEGKWITDGELFDRRPRNVFHKQLQPIELPMDEKRNNHVLFRKKFTVDKPPKKAVLYITADDCYKAYINGAFVGQGPAPSYHTRYNYNAIDVTDYLSAGENVLAVHTYYQGLINRVWQSGDYRHGLLCDLIAEDADGAERETLVKSDESFLTRKHTGYSEIEIGIMQTQIYERYDSRAAERDFYKIDFDDRAWENAKIRLYADYELQPQTTKMLEYEKISPEWIEKRGDTIFVDFGANYVGYLFATAKGERGEKIIVRQGQELTDEGEVRWQMRCRCKYAEEWILSGESDELSQFDYKSFRYAEIKTDGAAEISEIYLLARHYPFELKTKLSPEYADDEIAKAIWELCVRSQKYGVQDAIQDCMDREKGFYLGDGCYTALTNYLLTGDDSMARKLIDDAFASSFVTEGLLTCMDCSFMQEIAEYPLILVEFLLWHYRLSKDEKYLRENYFKAVKTLDFYKTEYEKDGLLQNIDRWCVVEWPKNYQDDYAVDIVEGKRCEEPHVAINAYYLHAIRTLNKIAEIIGEKPYREEQPLLDRFFAAFYNEDSRLFSDGTEHRHISLVGNAFPYAYGLTPDEKFEERFLSTLEEKGFAATSTFTSFPLLFRMAKNGDKERIKKFLFAEGTWRRMLREGATTTFESWGKETKWNGSLFHLTFSFAALFLADVDLRKTFE